MSAQFVEVALCLDAPYAPHAAVLMKSINANTTRPVRFHVLDLDTPADARDKITGMVRARRGECLWYDVDHSVPDEATAHGWSPSASYRLLLPQMLPAEVKRVLYIDIDTVVFDDIGEVFDFDLAGHALAAVRDWPGSQEDLDRRIEQLGSADYFNSGLLLMDLDAWRREKLADQVWDAMVKAAGAFRFPDQDALNAVFAGRWRHLPDRWNMQRPIMKGTASQLGFTPGEYIALALSPGMVHFTGSPKPWAGKQRHPFNWAYWRAARNTPFFENIKESSRGGYRKVTSRVSAYARFLLRVGLRALT